MLQILNLGDNPVFHRYRRSQLRLKTSIFWLLLTLIVTSFVISLPYIIETNTRGMPEEPAARNLWVPLLILQGLILLIKGTGRTAAGLIQDKIEQTLDYQRLTPLPPLQNIVGYLFGLPILEYAMFALTLPHLAFIVIKGNIPLLTVLAVYSALLVCTIFYHMTAVAVGMVVKRWILGYFLSVFAVIFLNLILPLVGAQLGLKFLQYLSVFPAIGEMLESLFGGFRGPGPFGPGFSFADPVPFFDWMLSPFLFTLLLQAALIGTFATIARRRWEKADKHSLSKPYALGILVCFVVLVVGNLWPVITAQFLPFPIFGSTELAARADQIALSLPIIYSMAVWFLCLILFANTVPNHHNYLRGLRRARKLQRKAARPWDDDSANLPFMGLFVAIALAGFALIFLEMQSTGFMRFLQGTGFAAWRLPLMLSLVLCYTLILLQTVEERGTVLCILLVWLLPILVAIVVSAALEEITRTQIIVASLSPLASLLIAGLLPTAQVYAPLSAGDEIAELLTGLHSGIFFLAAQIALLGWRWQHVRRRLH